MRKSKRGKKKKTFWKGLWVGGVLLVLLVVLLGVQFLGEGNYLRAGHYAAKVILYNDGVHMSSPWEAIHDRIYTYAFNNGAYVLDPFWTFLSDLLNTNIAYEYPASINDQYLSESELQTIANNCNEKHECEPFKQVACSGYTIREELEKKYHAGETGICCRAFERAVNAMIDLANGLDFGDLDARSTHRGFFWLNRRWGHVVNDIKFRPRSGPNVGKTFTYVYDAGFFPGAFFPLSSDAIKYRPSDAFPVLSDCKIPPPEIFLSVKGPNMCEPDGSMWFRAYLAENPTTTEEVILPEDADGSVVFGARAIGEAATKNVDFIFQTATYFIRPGESGVNLRVAVIDDNIRESDEGVWMTLYSVYRAQEGWMRNLSFIHDDESGSCGPSPTPPPPPPPSSPSPTPRFSSTPVVEQSPPPVDIAAGLVLTGW